jgi:hypothetical protein
MVSNTTSRTEPALSNDMTLPSEEIRRRRVRRNAWLLAAVAVGFYIAFIVMSLSSRQA